MKMKLNRLILLNAIFIFHSATAQLTFWNKLFLHYPLNGNTTDYSGMNNHGNAVEINYSTGIFNDENGAARLNGTNSYIYRQFFNLPDSCTLSGWFYSESDSQSTAMIYNGNTGSNGYGIFIKKPYGSLLTGYYGKKVVFVQGGVSENTFNGNYDFPKNEWIHLALVRRAQIFELYLNGELQTNGTINAYPPTSTFCLGSSPEHIQAGYPSFLGKIDEVMLFQSALEPQDIQKVFQANLTSNSSSQTKNNKIKLFPNPTNKENAFIISDSRIKNIKIYNSLGQLVEEITANNSLYVQLNTYKLPNGFYSIEVNSEAGIAMEILSIQ